ncbi:hypothetical protein [Kitasatospora sp. NPDC004272]
MRAVPSQDGLAFGLALSPAGSPVALATSLRGTVGLEPDWSFDLRTDWGRSPRPSSPPVPT